MSLLRGLMLITSRTKAWNVPRSCSLLLQTPATYTLHPPQQCTIRHTPPPMSMVTIPGRSFSSSAVAAGNNDDVTALADDGEEGVKLSDSCVQRLSEILDKGEYLRISVEGGGCSGFQYKFSVDQNRNEDDRLFERDGVGVLVDGDSLEFVRGATLDYGRELIREAFAIRRNPRADHACSCGASFSLKDQL